MTGYHLLLSLVVMRTASKGTERPFRRAKKAAEADDERGHAGLVDEDVHDLADIGVLRVIDACWYQSVTVKELPGIERCVAPSAKAAVLMTAIKAVVQTSLT